MDQINALYAPAEEKLTMTGNVGRGKKSDFGAKDVLFMSLEIIQNGRA